MLPERQFEIVTALAPTAIHDRIAPFVGPRVTPFGAGRAATPYWGSVALASFELCPNITYRNGFVPIAYGRVVPNGDGAHVTIRLRLLPFARIFMPIWLAFATLIFVVVSGAVLRDVLRSGFQWPHLVALALAALFPAAGLLFPRLGFRREARPLEEFLRRLLDAAEVPPYR